VPTVVLAYWNNKQSRVEVDIDASNRVTQIRRIGTPAHVTLSRSDLSRTYTLTETAISLNILTTTANRIQLTFDSARRRYAGWTGQVRA
jgi:hypothetical protein